MVWGPAPPTENNLQQLLAFLTAIYLSFVENEMPTSCQTDDFAWPIDHEVISILSTSGSKGVTRFFLFMNQLFYLFTRFLVPQISFLSIELYKWEISNFLFFSDFEWSSSNRDHSWDCRSLIMNHRVFLLVCWPSRSASVVFHPNNNNHVRNKDRWTHMLLYQKRSACVFIHFPCIIKADLSCLKWVKQLIMSVVFRSVHIWRRRQMFVH